MNTINYKTKVRGGIYGVTLKQKVRSCGNNSPDFYAADKKMTITPRIFKLKYRLAIHSRYVLNQILAHIQTESETRCRRSYNH